MESINEIKIKNKCESGSGGVNPCLGNKAKSATTSTTKTKDDQDDQAVRWRLRSERYNLQNQAREWLYLEGVKGGLEYPANYHRTAKCLYVPNGQGIGVHKSVEFKSAFYTGLQTCGSVWVCPVCATKIQERRRIEISKIMEVMLGAGYEAVMATFTIKHNRHQSFSLLQTMLSQCLRDLKSGNQFTLFKKRVGFQGMIRALEHTVGNNGWHPHTHELWFISSKADKNHIKEFIKKRWLAVCLKNGVLNESQSTSFLEHSVDFKFNCRTSDYLAKQDSSSHWGTDREIAKGTKKGSHPFSLLEKGDDKSRVLFIEYAKGVKGKAQLFFSKGLRRLAEIEDLTDEELVSKDNEEAFLLGLLSMKQWSIINHFKARAEILNIAELEGISGINNHIELLEKRLIWEINS